MNDSRWLLAAACACACAALLLGCGARAALGGEETKAPGAPDAPGAPGAAARAYELRIAGKLDEAKRALEAAVAERPGDAAAWLELARLEVERGVMARELDSARRAIEEAVAASPRDAALHRWAARIAMLSSILKAGDRAELRAQVERSIAEAERAVALDPDDHEARRMLVSLYGNHPRELGGDRQKARRNVEELEKRSPLDGATMRCELDLRGQEAKRVELWRGLAGAHDADPRFHASLARELAWSGDGPGAEAEAARALALDPARAHVLLDVARAFALRKELEPAERLLRRFLAYEPSPPLALRAWAQMALGQVLGMKGDKDGAAAALGKAREMYPHVWMTMTPPPEQLFDPA